MTPQLTTSLDRSAAPFTDPCRVARSACSPRRAKAFGVAPGEGGTIHFFSSVLVAVATVACNDLEFVEKSAEVYAKT
jgi:hypothetical protein